METKDNITGTQITCSNPDCDAMLEIITPCPHDSTYTCACGHPMELAPLH